MTGNTQAKSKKTRKSGKKEPAKRNVVLIDNNEIELTEKVVNMGRVAKVVKGGRRFSFNALTVVGDGERYVGVGFGKAKEVPEAIRKSIEAGKKNIIKVKRNKATIPHAVIGKFKSARVLLKPGAPGTGIIAGEAVRAVVELGGIHDILTKAQGTSNPLNIVKATIDGLSKLTTAEEAKNKRGLTLPDVFGEYSKKRREEKKIQATEQAEKEAKKADEALIRSKQKAEIVAKQIEIEKEKAAKKTAEKAKEEAKKAEEASKVQKTPEATETPEETKEVESNESPKEPEMKEANLEEENKE